MGILAGVRQGIVAFVINNILSAACLMLGFSPSEFIAGLWFDPPPWLYSPIVRVAAGAIGIVLAWVSWRLFLYIRDRHQRADDAMMPMSDAGQLAYEVLHQTRIKELGEDHWTGEPHDYYRHVLAREIPVFGQHNSWAIDPREFNDGRFVEGGNVFQRQGMREPVFKGLRVKKKRLDRFLSKWRKRYRRPK